MKLNTSSRAWINTVLIAILVAVWVIDLLRDTEQEDELEALEQRVVILERALDAGTARDAAISESGAG